MPKLERLSAVVRQVLTSFPCLEAGDTPWTVPSREMKHGSLALVTSAGLHLRGDKPFAADVKGGDTSYRVIPSDAKATDILQSHTSIGFDHSGIYRDLNVTFPLDRLRELTAKASWAAWRRTPTRSWVPSATCVASWKKPVLKWHNDSRTRAPRSFFSPPLDPCARTP